ncbi:MAG: hypothetical protein IIX96_02995 [Clostridia bacterium]|nr:hypothetical protein [Clostridia bacterium]
MIKIKRTVIFILCFSILITLSSCSERVSAEELIREFAAAYGTEGVIYTSSAKEGEEGYIDAELYRKLYDSEADFETDFAVMLSEGLDFIYEVGAFVAYDSSSALAALETVLMRIDFLSEMGYAEAPVVIRRGNTVLYSTLPDKEGAERIFKRMAIYSHRS